MKKIGIVGAGVSGLTLACLLKKNTNYDISIFEKANLIHLKLAGRWANNVLKKTSKGGKIIIKKSARQR